MDDLISRKWLMECVDEGWIKFDTEKDKNTYVHLVRDIAPSAQPQQIVRCKDCKHRDPEDKKCDCGHDIQWQLPRRDDWYCADAERREVTNGN